MNKNRVLGGVRRLIIIQIGICLMITLLLFLFSGAKAAGSALTGGLVAILPSAVFAKRLFKYQGARAAKEIVKNFYQGEFLKIILSMILFALVFIFYEVQPLVFFLTYIALVMTNWFAPLIIDNRQERPKSD
ncbi:ATP synthase subunit I [Legionella dresdenensis]|uniref:ATP synthase subunit I n=1 Tax=Legionella dresdenensis TaxID=450200 RepID=A0ABV8CDI3_9GAMM